LFPQQLAKMEVFVKKFWEKFPNSILQGMSDRIKNKERSVE
jgi:hypothetical protein